MAVINSNAKRILGYNMRRLRKQRGWSQEYLAEVSGLSRNFISYLERFQKSPSIDTISTLSEAFDVEVYKLFET